MKNLEPHETRHSRRAAVSGSAVVALMFAFGAVATGILWTYWYYHSAPFMPLEAAIGNEFRGSAPRVDGGQRRMHKGTPTQLWITMRVFFEVENDEAQVRSTVNRVIELAEQKLDLKNFQFVTVRLFRGELEKYLHKQDVEFEIVNGRAVPASATAAQVSVSRTD